MTSKRGPSSDLPQPAVEALWHGHVIDAIQLVRLERNIGLKEAKEQVDAYIGTQPALQKKMEQILGETRQRFIRWLIGILLLAVGVAYLVM